jgi:nickel-type superoxide dismutase maturation protease
MRFVVEGESMLPAYRAGDYLLVDVRVFLSRNPRVGEAVVAKDPRDPSRRLLKRVTRVEPGPLVWLEGDNPEGSTDSRHFGPVAELEGLVRWRYWRGGGGIQGSGLRT